MQKSLRRCLEVVEGARTLLGGILPQLTLCTFLVQDVQLLLYATVRLAQNASLLHRSSSSSSSTPRVIEGLHSNMAAGCCIGCFQHKLG